MEKIISKNPFVTVRVRNVGLIVRIRSQAIYAQPALSPEEQKRQRYSHVATISLIGLGILFFGSPLKALFTSGWSIFYW